MAEGIAAPNSAGARGLTAASGPAAAPPQPAAMPWWLRLYLLLGTAQGLGMGLTGLISPAEMQIPLRISPLNARVAAAMYTAAALGLLIAAFTRLAYARILVLCFATDTTLILAVNLLHWSDFMAPQLPHRGLWIGAYIVDPIAGALVIVAAGYLGAGASLASRPRDAQGALFAVAAVVMTVVGAVLLFAPAAASAAWPWVLPPTLAQVYGCFFLAFALAGALATGESRPVPRRIVAAAFVALAALVLLASLLHVERFRPGPATWLWFGGFIFLGAAAGAALLRDGLSALASQRAARAAAPAVDVVTPLGHRVA